MQHVRTRQLPGPLELHDRRPPLRRRRAALRCRPRAEARPHRPDRREADLVSDTDPRSEESPEEEARPLTGEPPSPAAMRLRAEPPRVTRLSRKVLAGLALVASVGIGGALVYALQTRDGSRPNRSEERRVGKEWVSTCRFRWSAAH